MIPLDDIELNGLKYNDCIDISLKQRLYGYNRFFFAGFDTCNVIKNGKEAVRMISNIIITPTKAIEGITTKPIRVPIEEVDTIIIND